MTREEIIEMAREVDLIDFRDAADDPHTAQMVEFLERFAALVAAKESERMDKEFPIKFASQEAWTGHVQWVASVEREACARVCEEQQVGFASYFEIDERIRGCAEAIRARSQP